jgi:hypothetical protein
VKVKIAVLCISVFQPVREILLAELLKDFLLVFRLKAAQYKIVLAELRSQAFIKGFSRTEKGVFIFVVFHPENILSRPAITAVYLMSLQKFEGSSFSRQSVIASSVCLSLSIAITS